MQRALNISLNSLMAGKGELGFPNTSGCSLKEQLARTTLRNVRSQGHTYVELREDGKRHIFFCTLCLAPCYSDSVLYDHLKGNLHSERLAAAKVTLLKSNPWPFNDGVLFFHNPPEEDKPLPVSKANQITSLEINSDDDDNGLAIVPRGGNPSHCSNGHGGIDVFGYRDNLDSTGTDTDSDDCSFEKSMSENGGHCGLIIPGVLRKDEVGGLEVNFVGFGKIAARYFEKDDVSNEIRKLWCEWLGKIDSGDEDTLLVQEHEFAVVTFANNYDLGRKGLFDDVKYLLTSSTRPEIEVVAHASKKRKKSFSDPEDISESLSNPYDSSGEESQSSNSFSSRLLLSGYDDQLMHSRFILSKTMRRELRRQQRIAAERMCDICQHKMLPGKDVATLLNTKTGRLPCSSRNVNGAFHVFHISCLIHWILLCEFETLSKPPANPKVKRKTRRKRSSKCSEIGKDGEIGHTRKQIYSVFCPECQGTGIDIEGDELEKPTVPLSEMFKYKIKVSDARREWMKSPEVLQNCSTGFHFPSKLEDAMIQESVLPLKLLRFYRANA